MATMWNLPQEIPMEILSRLPVKSLLRFRCVSKNWYNLIGDPYFITHHFNHSAENNPAFIFLKTSITIRYESSNEPAEYKFYPVNDLSSTIKVAGSCNGLVCLSISVGQSHKDSLCIWNPATRRVHYVPDAPTSFLHMTRYRRGFGFDPIHTDYKVIHIVHFFGERKDLLFVYSLSTGEWRELGEVSFIVNWNKRPAFVNGAVHWMTESKFILSFDMAIEKFQELPEHDYGGEDKLLYKSLGVVGGYLSVVDAYMEYLEIWAMKDYGRKHYWTKLLTICDLHRIVFAAPYPPNSVGCAQNLQVIEIRRNGEVILVVGRSAVISYDPKSDRLIVARSGAGKI